MARVSGSTAITAMGMSICFGALALAFNLVCLSEIGGLLKLKNNLSDADFVFQLTMATSAFNLGTILSTFVAKLNGLLYIDILAITTTVAQLTVLRYEVLVATRLILGLLFGISTAIIPVYLNSIAPPEIAGRTGTYNQVFQTLGVLLAYSLGLIINSDIHDQIRWRIYLGTPILILLFRIISLQIFFPFNAIARHIENKEMNKVKEFCLMLYNDGSEEKVEELIKIKAPNIGKSKSKTVKEVQSEESKKTWRLRFVVAILVIASNQFSGINSILYYAKFLFSKVTEGKEEYSKVLILQLSVLQVVATLISTETVDRIGRRTLLIGGQFLLSIALLAIVIESFIGGKEGEISLIFLLFTHVLIMNMTLGPICIVYCTEILGDITWVIITLKGCSWLVAQTTMYMIEYWGLGPMFLLFFFLTTFSLIFLYPRLKETRGLTREQVYHNFAAKESKQDSEYRLIQSDQA